jgi:hypothetical protein
MMLRLPQVTANIKFGSSGRVGLFARIRHPCGMLSGSTHAFFPLNRPISPARRAVQEKGVWRRFREGRQEDKG